MLIEIKKDNIEIRSLSQKPIVKKFLESGLKLKVFEKIHAGYKLVDWIYKELKINDNEIYINKFWAYKFCEQEGLEKKEFINFQILAFEIKEINDSLNFIKVFKDNKRYAPNWETTAKRLGRDTKKMINIIKGSIQQHQENVITHK